MAPSTPVVAQSAPYTMHVLAARPTVAGSPDLITAVSAKLGVDDVRYHAKVPTDAADDIVLESSRQRMRAELPADGQVEIAAGAARMWISLIGWGYGDQVHPLGDPSARSVADNWVSYRRGATEEWFISGPAGIQHGVTLAGAPPRGESGPLTLELAMTGGVSRALHPNADGLSLRTADGGVLDYAGLVVVDATGRRLPAWLELPTPNSLRIRVDDTDAVYPVTVDPLIQQAKLTGADGDIGDYLGAAVAVDGDTLVVGAPGETNGGTLYCCPGQGAVHVFVRPPGGSWADAAHVARLTAADAADGAGLGASVAIDGDTVVAGAPGASGVGGVYVFTRPSGGWADASQSARLTASDGVADDQLGFSVAIEGATIVAGAPFADGRSEEGGPPRAEAGAVYSFVRPEGGWADGTETVRVTAVFGGEGDAFGYSVALTAGEIVVGAPQLSTAAPNAGGIYVFSRSGADSGFVGVALARLTAATPVADANLGFAVAVSGATVVAGAPGVLTGSGAPGAVLVFRRPPEQWTSGTESVLVPSPESAPFDSFGHSVAVEGDTMAVGQPGDPAGGPGAVRVFRPDAGADWTSVTQTALLAENVPVDDRLGHAVAISGDTIAAGAPLAGPQRSVDAIVPLAEGRAALFPAVSGSWSDAVPAARVGVVDPDPSAALGSAVAVDGDTAVVGAPNDPEAGRTGAVYVFTRSAAGWGAATQVAKLNAGNAPQVERFGAAVAIDGDTVVVGAPGSQDGAGTAFVYVRSPSGWAGAVDPAAVLTKSELTFSSEFGRAVAIDGDTVVVGARGITYVYSRPSDGWASGTETAALFGNAESPGFGSAVAVQGTVVAVGDPMLDDGRGAVLVYVRPGATWLETGPTAILTAPESQALGYSVAMTPDAVIAGAPNGVEPGGVEPGGVETGNVDTGPDVGGAVYVFARPAGGWTGDAGPTARLSATGAQPGDQLGAAVGAVDGAVAAGAPGRHGTGAVYLFDEPAGGWIDGTESETRVAIGSVALDGVGSALAMTSDTILVGAPGDDSAAPDHGAAYVFDRFGSPPSEGTDEPESAPVFAASPEVVTFGAALPLSAPVVRTVVVINTGEVSASAAVALAAVGGGPAPVDFRIVSDGCSGRILAPGESCEIDVAFSPWAAGARSAVLRVELDGVIRPVALRGEGLPQSLAVNPIVCRAKCVAQVSGRGFPPGQLLSLDLAMLAAGRPPLEITAAADGSFTITLVVMPHSTIGQIPLMARAAGAPVSAEATLLVAPGSLRPPDFLVRR